MKKLILDKGLTTERAIPFTHLNSDGVTLQASFVTTDPAEIRKIDMTGLRGLTFSTVKALDDSGEELPLIGSFDTVVTANISYTERNYTALVVLEYKGA